jgi:HTH-type transcriptional regulator/antitoxin HigA
MITNDRQYKIAKSQVEKFQTSLEDLPLIHLDVQDIHPDFLQIQKNAIQFKLKELLNEIKEYEDLKAGKIIITEVKNLGELPLVLIKARIANGLTQAEFAGMLGMKEQQIQRLESEKYETASLRTLMKIAEYLKIKLSADVQIKEIDSPEEFDMKKYPFKQMFQRKWFNGFVGSLNEAATNSATLISNFFEAAGIKALQPGYTKRTIRAGSSLNEFALHAWYARVLTKAREQKLTTFFDKSCITEHWLHELAKLSIEIDGPIKAFEYLNNIGVRTVIEAQLDGTQLDGAALLLDDIYPVIALTLRYDRIDNFWFVLFHEIAHVFLHLGSELSKIFDDLDESTDGIEKDADEFALNALIPNDTWKKSLVRFSPSNETIINQAKSLKIHPALIAGRIRKETGKFHQFTDLIGQGQVRKLFANELNN